MNLAAKLTAVADRLPSKTALKLDDQELTYRGLDMASSRLAALLRERGLEPGDRVGIMLPNVPEFAVAYYGALRAGCIVVPINVMLRSHELAYYLRDSETTLLLAWHGLAETAEAGAAAAGSDCLFVTPGELARLLAAVEPAREPCERAPSDTAALLYTSGTSGTPKGAELTHANLVRNLEAVIALRELGERDVLLGALPLFHAFGQTSGLNATIAAGGCLTLMQRFDAACALAIVERDGVTILQGVPTMYAALVGLQEERPFDLSTLRLCVSGGSAMPAELMRRTEQTLGCPVIEGYGLSETSPVTSSNRNEQERRPGSVGRPIDGVEMRVVGEDGTELPRGEVGEIVIRGHNVMKGYWRQPEASAEALRGGWFHTGDLGRMDGDGYFYVVDRIKDVIIRAGYNVYPRELEELLHEHPAVAEAAVIGLPHPELGEEVGAAVVLHNGAGVSPEELREYVRERVAPYKYPRRVWLCDELPKGPSGKILKRAIGIPRQTVSL